MVHLSTVWSTGLHMMITSWSDIMTTPCSFGNHIRTVMKPCKIQLFWYLRNSLIKIWWYFKQAFLSSFELISGKNICQNDANIQPNEDRCQNAKNDGIFFVTLIKEITRSMQGVTKISPSILSQQRVHQLKYSEWSSPNTTFCFQGFCNCEGYLVWWMTNYQLVSSCCSQPT